MNRGLGPRFRHNTLSAVLLQSHPNSVWPMLKHSAREGWAAWGALSQGMQSGQVPFQVSIRAETCWGQVFTCAAPALLAVCAAGC